MSQLSIDDIFKSPYTKHRLTLFKPEDVKGLEVTAKRPFVYGSELALNAGKGQALVVNHPA